MQALEQTMRRLAAKLTGKDLSEIPGGELERVVGFMADNASETGSGTTGPKGDPGAAGPKGEKGDPGPAGASVSEIHLIVAGDGTITSGKAKLSDGTETPITIVTE